jgi:hypothetical protein
VASRIRFKNEQIEAALRASAGKASIAAQKLGCSASLVWDRMKKFPKLREVAEEERESIVDLAEIKLKQAVMEGQAWAVCFTLKCLGKNRGWVERHQIESKSELSLGVTAKIIEDTNWFGNADSIPPGAFEVEIQPSGTIETCE